MRLSSQLQSDRSVLPLLLSNLLTLVWAVAEGWRIVDVMLVYWVQSVIIGYYNYHRIMDLKKFSTENFSMNNRRPDPTPETQKSVARFFALHYGVFHAAYLAFILGRDSGEISLSSRPFWRYSPASSTVLTPLSPMCSLNDGSFNS